MKRFIQQFGPGLITAALVFGPGSLTVATKLGSGYGYSLLWVIVLTTLFMMAYTRLSARIGLSTDRSLMQVIQMRYGRISGIFLGLGIFLITASFQAGNSIGAGVAFAELFQTSTKPWVIFFAAAAIVMLFFRNFYRILEKVMMILVTVMLSSFALTLIMSKPDLGRIALGFLPSIPGGSEFLIIAITASSFSVVGAFYQSYLVQEKGWKKEDSRACLNESRNGIVILALLTGLIMMCASAVLFGLDKEVNTASDLGQALEPLFGKFTSTAFMIGFFAASFSSLIGNATIGGAILADAFSLGQKLSSGAVRMMIVCVIVAGAIVAILFGTLPLQLIIFAQAITILIAPAAAIFIILIANSLEIMEMMKQRIRLNFIPVMGLITLLVLAVYNAGRILGYLE